VNRPVDLAAVLAGVEEPWSPEGVQVLLVEPSATVNTGDTPGGLTAERRVVEP
jgi:hypothetical protein